MPPRAGRRMSVARQITWLQVGVVAVLVLVAGGLAVYDTWRDARSDATDQAVAIAEAVADSPTVRAAVAEPATCTRIQPYAEQVRADTGVDFVVVMGLDRIRCSHPDPAQLGEPFVGDLGDAPEGGVFTQEYTGTLGPSMRSVVPVWAGAGAGAEDRRVIGLVSVGITVEAIDAQVRSDLLQVGLLAALVLGVGLVGTWLVSRRLQRQTHGLGEAEITRMYEYYSAVLHAVSEGLVLLDAEGRVQLVNDEARRLLDLPDDVQGRPLHSLGLAPALVADALDADASRDELFLAGDRALVVSSSPATWDGHGVGAVVTLRDHTDLVQVTGERDQVRALTDTLRAQTHEAANRLHTVVSLIEMGRPGDAVEFAVGELALAQRLADRLVGQVGDPAVAALVLGKSAEAAERGIDLTVDGALEPGVAPPRELVTVIGNLLDNAFDAVGSGGAGAAERRVALALDTDGDVRIEVADSGPGLDADAAARVLERGWSTKASGAEGRGVGLALVARIARRHHGDVAIDRSLELGGARFVVSWPLPESARGAAPAAAGQREGASR